MQDNNEESYNTTTRKKSAKLQKWYGIKVSNSHKSLLEIVRTQRIAR
jgi:hypothetical protein